MATVTLLDAGLLDKDEEHHAWTTHRIRGLTPPLLTCEAVLTEACFLLSALIRARLQLRLWIQSGFVQPVSLGFARK